MHRRSRPHVTVFIFLGLALLLTGCPKRPAMTQVAAPPPPGPPPPPPPPPAPPPPPPPPGPPPPPPPPAPPAPRCPHSRPSTARADARPTSARGHSGASDPGSRAARGLPAEPCPQGGVFRLRQEPDSAG